MATDLFTISSCRSIRRDDDNKRAGFDRKLRDGKKKQRRLDEYSEQTLRKAIDKRRGARVEGYGACWRLHIAVISQIERQKSLIAHMLLFHCIEML